MKTVVGLFDYIDDVESAVTALEAAGIPRDDISAMADHSRRHENQFATGSASSAEDLTDVIVVDATAGAAIGGATGLVMALTGLVIPGFGPIVAAGWLVSTLAGAAVGAAAGGLIGGLTGAGIPLEDAMYYKEGIRMGATLLAVRADDTRAGEVAAILDQKGAININERAEQYRQQGLISPTGNSFLQQPLAPSGSALPTNAEHSTGANSEPTPNVMIVQEPMPVSGSARVTTGMAETNADRSDTSAT